MAERTLLATLSSLDRRGWIPRELTLITRLRSILVLLAIVLFMAFSNSSAQNPRQEGPGSQANSPDAPLQPLDPDISGSSSLPATFNGLSPSSPTPEESTQPQPDTHVLSSGETLGLGTLRGLTRIFDPALQFSQSAQTGIVAGRSLAVSELGGSLGLAKNWRHYRLAVAYNGAETIYQPSYNGIHSLPYQHLGISQEITMSRWTLRLHDDMQYSWAAGFGGFFTGGPSQTGQNGILNSIQPSLLPSETIQTGLARQVSNAILGEADYSFSRRTTLTFVGSYNLLHFFVPGYIDSQDVHQRIGYNYALSAKNNIALSYDHDRLNFTGTSSRVQTDLVQLAFGRKITGRLAFQLAAGPELIHLYNFGSSSRRQVSWSAFNAVTYNLGHSEYSLSYSHAVTAGSGVFVGSQTDSFTAGARRNFTRFWSASLNGGYANNRDVVPVAVLASRFENWFTGATLNRQIGRQVGFGLNYRLQWQSTGNGSCPVLRCGLAASWLHQFGVTLQWHPFPPQSQ